jgi:hypothetical protein
MHEVDMQTKALRMLVTRRTFLQLAATLPVVIAQLGSQRSLAGHQQVFQQNGYGLGAYGQSTYPGMTSNRDLHAQRLDIQAIYPGATSNLYLPFVSKTQ